MNEETYNHSILANTSVTADFAEWYGSEYAKVLVIAIKAKVVISYPKPCMRRKVK